MDQEAKAYRTERSVVTQKGMLDIVKVQRTGTSSSLGDSGKLPGGGVFALSL